ncbi:HNH endonuclease [Streptomyces sp. NBC_00487]|uniref:HNH endonuclease n=1 Tax=unclassified Streptomyces TaxID=2593676 RepID=UPI002E188067|nr:MULTISPECIES: HNH endonuclease signature motif containing protein [unclassified Streptomyces]
MAQGRPDIPADLKRAVLVEAGHRCAIPTCRQTPVEIAHITAWVKVREHKFENLIALCPTCHARFDRGEIDRKAMRQYKENLEIINSRYTDTESQFLKVCAQNWEAFRRKHLSADVALDDFREGRVISLGNMKLHTDMWWLLSNLLDDGIITFGDRLPALFEEGLVTQVSLTDKGCSLIGRIVDAEPI